ncbi:hypothetical protein [Yinghuangia seranimata]|uniref:hypothetical protein n=1 Tax=Yinghuangia seranimata TaxID=408067 RepID=UPI00248AE848|nr:hypothetical protein [Yinghuangia seranimata]MDI2127951.1 hypothetical protein [Yinghuangia seranimata]
MTYAAQALAAARAYGLPIPDQVDQADALHAAVHAAANAHDPDPPQLPTSADDLPGILATYGQDVAAVHAARAAAAAMCAPAAQQLHQAVAAIAAGWIKVLATDFDTSAKQFTAKARNIPYNAREDSLGQLNPKQFGDWQQARKHAHTLDTITELRETIARAAGEPTHHDKALFAVTQLPPAPDNPDNWPDIAAHITAWRDRRADPVRRWVTLTTAGLPLTLAPLGAPTERAAERERWRENYINRKQRR